MEENRLKAILSIIDATNEIKLNNSELNTLCLLAEKLDVIDLLVMARYCLVITAEKGELAFKEALERRFSVVDTAIDDVKEHVEYLFNLERRLNSDFLEEVTKW